MRFASMSVGVIRNDYTSTSVTTAAYVQLSTGFSTETTMAHIFDSSGKTLKLAVGDSGAQVDFLDIVPNMNMMVPFHLSTNTKLWIKAIDTNATTGQLIMNIFY